MRKLKATMMVLPVFAGACATAPEYNPPAATQAAAGPFVTQSTLFDTLAPLPDDWWRLYRDPVLDDLVARALAANTDLRIASANLVKASAIAREARIGRLPATDLTGGLSYGDAAQSGAGSSGGAQLSGNAGLALAWEADLFGRVSSAIDAAQADAEAVEAARDAVRVTVVAETTRTYLSACSLATTLDVARQSLAISQQSLDLIEAKQRVGSANRLDVERAAAAAATARSVIPGLEGQRQATLFELAALLGLTPSEVPQAARTCLLPPEPVGALPVGDGAQLLRRRPDLRQAERQLAADTARIGVAVADLYPRISLGASGNFFRSDAVQGSDSFSFSLGPLLSWSFPNVGLARARLQQAEAQGDAALAAFDGKVLTALKEVEQALTYVETGTRQADALADAQSRAEEAYRIAGLRNRSGSIAQLELLSTQAELLQARSAYAASLQQLTSARIDLFKALGGGWRSDETARVNGP